MKKLLYIFLSFLLLTACKQQASEETVAKNEDEILITKEQFQTMKMEIDSPIEQDFNVGIKATGKIDVPPENRVKITSFFNW
jgi:cobalt-zinc-cadmium efflux system membrane fusion protein